MLSVFFRSEGNDSKSPSEPQTRQLYGKKTLTTRTPLIKGVEVHPLN